MTLAVPPRLGSARRRWPYAARQVAWAAVDLLFPPQCGGCRAQGERFCEACCAALQWIEPPLCEQCGYPRPEKSDCLNCRRHPVTPLMGIRSAAFFEGPLQNALHALKYKRDVILADSLARLLVHVWDAHGLPGEVVMPVPLSAERMRERGYNQAGLLARGFAELAGLRHAPDGLRRIRHTASQVGLTAEQRRHNVRAAFDARPAAVEGRAVIIVDDVCTTGATLAACAEALLARGASQVWGLTLGRAR